MNRDLLLTIITITKDDSVGVSRTLASTEAWRNEVWVEQVVVDASAMPTAMRDERIRVIRQNSTGISGAFNEGLAHVRGKWVWFLNGGDEIDAKLEPVFLRKILEATRADALIGGITYEGENEPQPHPPAIMQWPTLLSWVPHPSTLVRYNLFERFGFFDVKYTIVMDYDFWMRAFTSPGVAVDVTSIPFSIFAAGGVSQRSDCRDRLTGELDNVIRSHQGVLWRIWLAAGFRLLRASRRAFCRRVLRRFF